VQKGAAALFTFNAALNSRWLFLAELVLDGSFSPAAQPGVETLSTGRCALGLVVGDSEAALQGDRKTMEKMGLWSGQNSF
jgi:hypothetical protein